MGETLVDASEREAKEETGLEVVVDHLVGVYQCPRTSEGFGVVNFVFASHVVGGSLATTTAHPEVGYFTRSDIEALQRRHLLRGTHIKIAIEAHERGQYLPLTTLEVVPAAPLPD